MNGMLSFKTSCSESVVSHSQTHNLYTCFSKEHQFVESHTVHNCSCGRLVIVSVYIGSKDTSINPLLMSLIAALHSTVEPLIKDIPIKGQPPNKGHSKDNLPTKDSHNIKGYSIKDKWLILNSGVGR